MPEHDDLASLNPIAALIAEEIEARLSRKRPLVVGICGTQASGKSTACAQLTEYFTGKGLTVGTLSLDDLYLSKADRAHMAARVHPLFATRGPPGTHNISLGKNTLDAFLRGESVRLPRFDKRADVPLPVEQWPELPAGAALMLFEGWCVGARPQHDSVLAEPVNALEREEDGDAVWRTFFNDQLMGETGQMFSRLDRLIYLRPPSFKIVHKWRCEQEQAYQRTDGSKRAAAAMTEAQVARFIAHYERMTREMMASMPRWADLTIQLDQARVPVML